MYIEFPYIILDIGKTRLIWTLAILELRSEFLFHHARDSAIPRLIKNKEIYIHVKNVYC